MSSLASQYTHPALQQRLQPEHTTRIPTKSPRSEHNNQSNTLQHVSKLAKRASRSITTTESSSTSTSRPPTHLATAAPCNIPAPPLSANPSATATPPPPSMRTPSLVSASSVSTFDSPRSTALRRKQSGAIDRYAAQKRNAPDMIDRESLSRAGEVMRSRSQFDDSLLGISLPPTFSYGQPHAQNDYAHDYCDHHALSREFTPPVPGYAQSATPSTRYTDSPFSHVPTPSSASSYSPGIMATSAPGPRSQTMSSPAKSYPPVSQRSSIDKGPKSSLAPVRESSTSSSNSTVKVGARQHVPKKESAPKSNVPPQVAKTSTLAKKPSRRKLAKEQLPAPASKRPLQAPPELAHLNVDPPKQKINLQKPLAPPRPSRDGTSDLPDLSRPSPVVQSDLPRLYTTYHKRTPSQETPVPASSPRSKSRLGFSSRTPSRNESPRIDSAISPSPSARRFHRGPTPDTATREGAAPSRKDSPAVGPGPSPSKSPRFGIFSRKSKAEAKVVEKPVRRPFKGPAAGTGHEGYGRFSGRGRNGSAGSSTGFRSPSADSTTSSAIRPSNVASSRKSSRGSTDAAELDDFLRERLEPKVLRGSGSTFNTGSSSDFLGASLYPASSNTSSLESYPQPRLLPSAMQSSDSFSSSRRHVLARNNASESSGDDLEFQQPTIAARRSLTRLSQTDSKSPVRMPAPIDTSLPPSTTAYLDSNDVETAWPRTDSSMPPFEDPFRGDEGLWLRSPPPEPIAKQSRKWNFFQRSKGKAKTVDPPTILEMPPRSPQRAVAHYAMPDSQDPLNLDEVRRLVLDNDTSQDESASESNRSSKIVPYEGRHLSLLPSPPSPGFSSDSYFKARPSLPRISVQRQDSAETTEVLDAQPALPYQAAHVANVEQSPLQGHLNSLAVPPDPFPVLVPAMGTPEPDSSSKATPDLRGNDSPRQPRLSPIGRIPAVVSRRDRDRKLSDHSFSRPFARHQPRPTVKPPGSVYNQIREMASPIEAGSQPVSSTSTRSDFNSTEVKSSNNTNPASTSTNRASMDIHNQNEFFVFPPRKNSEQSYQSGSTSSGYPSWMNALYPPPQQHEDVWDEYDDLMDDHVPPKKAKAKKSLGAPLQYSDTVYGGNIASLVPPPAGQPPTSELPIPPGSEVTSTVLSVPQQISRFLQPSLTPMTPDTISALIGGYGSRSTSTLFVSNRDSSQTEGRVSTQQPLRSSFGSVQGSVMAPRHSRGSRHSRTASLPEARHSQASTAFLVRPEQDVQLSDIVEVPGELSPSARLRQSALTTSKWLSFGRVLFSPAHNELQFVNEPRVLVLDGLSSDWSFYVALSYPEATVYNMGASLSASPSLSWPESDGPPPPNHRQIPLTTIAASFPFPKGFFTAVVLRYPIATTEASYAACISECKRVLRPGGHLEVAVLDLDLVNMGSKARKAVRGLKTRMQQNDREVCLQNLSDVLVRLIGRRGFESVQRCVVGVPTAGRIPRSQDLSSSGSGSSAMSRRHVNARRGSHNDFSFSNLLVGNYGSQYEPGKNNDESITKMVAKVGRWWYSTCYEKALLPTDRSIWNESGLVRECEKQGTSFRLLICHAQKPLQTRRRTVSV
ncbi:hypothetical protein AC579_6866 [Pseudocercospora musae]|uniref:Methyltransferase type 11 domain-containing protein n=1 Tax=Pseudocercospora musae TaxID=113226 RepID=A0A139I9A1_9PEZI|nr:hypothetical protein AC579_6866 [Pseudocercospora musae]